MHLPADDARRVLEHVPDVVVLGSDTGRIDWISPSVQRLLGWSPESLVSTSFLQLVHPDDAQRVRSVQRGLNDAVDGGGAIRLRRADHTYRWVDVSVSPLIGADGRVSGRVACWHDVHAQIDARSTDHIVIERLQAALHAMVDPYVWLEAIRRADGTIVDFVSVAANQAAADYFGRSANVMRGHTVSDVVSPERFSFLLEAASDVLETGHPYAVDGFETTEHPHSSPAYYDVRMTRVDDDGVTVMWRNVTAREELSRLRSDLVLADAEASERNRLARDLHDGLLQQVIASGMLLGSIVPSLDAGNRVAVERILDMQNEQVRHIRALMLGMVEPIAANAPLEANLERIIADAARVLRDRPVLHVLGSLRDIDPFAAEQLLYALSELLANVARHAAASSVRVDLVVDRSVADSTSATDEGPDVDSDHGYGTLTLVVTDDGIGIDHVPRAGRGLLNLGARAAFVGGSFSIDRGAHGGTVATWTAITHLSPD